MLLGWDLWQDSQLFLPVLMPVFFSFAQYVGVAQLVSGFLSEGIVPYVPVDSGCLWEE